jgi:hypothetical protein
MKITNKFDIPQTFVNVLQRPTYSKGKAHLSVTQLINSPKIVALSAKFEDELEQDASEMVWSLFGSAVHNILERGKDDYHIVEQRLFTTFEGWTLSGAIDLQILSDKGRSIRDYKVTSVWSAMRDKIEWEQQLNIYAWLVETVTKDPVIDLGIVAIIRDWNRRDSLSKEGYPKAPISEIPVRLWTMEEREAYVSERIKAHSECEFALETGSALPQCSSVEMWERPTTWAVKKVGASRAKSVHLIEADAVEALNNSSKDYEIEVRNGERIRCATFCPVNQYCAQWRDYCDSQ